MNGIRIIRTVRALVAVAAVSVLASCEPVFQNDKLDYYWRLDQIEYADGRDFKGQACQVDTIENTMFGFARHIVLIEDLSHGFSRHGVTIDKGDTLIMDYSMYADTAAVLTGLQRCGLDSIVTAFKVEYPDRKSMVLSSNKAVLRFRKW